MMHRYPIYIDLSQASCLVVGAGQIAERKIKTLLCNGLKQLSVIDLNKKELGFCPYEINASIKYNFINRAFEPNDLTGFTLVFAATNNNELNLEISKLCVEKSILCNVISSAKHGSFVNATCFNLDDLQVSLFASGAGPKLSKNISKDIEKFLLNRYKKQMLFLKKVRPYILQNFSKNDKEELLNAFSSHEFMTALNDYDKVDSAMFSILDEHLHFCIEELVNVYNRD